MEQKHKTSVVLDTQGPVPATRTGEGRTCRTVGRPDTKTQDLDVSLARLVARQSSGAGADPTEETHETKRLRRAVGGGSEDDPGKGSGQKVRDTVRRITVVEF